MGRRRFHLLVAAVIGPVIAALLPSLSSSALTGGTSRPNRRVRASGTLWTCRLCWKPITIEARHIEEDPPHVYLHCPNCGHSFPIRGSDR